MAPHSSTLAWKIPLTEEPGRLQSMGSQRAGHDWEVSLSLFLDFSLSVGYLFNFLIVYILMINIYTDEWNTCMFHIYAMLSHFSGVRLRATHRWQPTRLPHPWILQARTLEWVAISFSNAWKWKVKVKLLSHVRLLATPWTAAYQASLSMGFSRQEYWSGLPLPSPYNH